MKERLIKDDEYIQEFQPVGIWCLVEKDLMPEKTKGGIILASSGRQDSLKTSGTGYIRGMAPESWGVFEAQHDRYWHSMFRVGDRIGFNTHTPIMSPAPPQWQFAIGGAESMKFIQICLTDITGIFLESDAQRKEWAKRFKEAFNG